MNEKFMAFAEQALRETSANGFSDEVIRASGYTASVSKAFVERFADLCLADMMRHLAAHALSNSTALDVYAQWSSLYEGSIPEKEPLVAPLSIDDWNF